MDEKVLAFVDIFVDSLMIDEVLRDLNAIDNVIEIYEVTGEFDIVTLIRSDNIEEFRNILKNRVMKIKGIKSTVSSIVLSIDKISQRNSE
ncbi:MAG: Lrp/AsnC ligand binding domain-containing protein [Candidatus Thermoplasmatota archaeon]|nr:Lrp/AsnC ligand binding domain-containing protein [Candidatus Thermoplasmatota archaeon]MCL5438330.1 Lrp/AsnC ligand binding domain-containing protein [Candidatus Thermoplasmatota archaeon]